MFTKNPFLLLASTLSLSFATQASELALEPFDGPLDTPVAGTGTGTGWFPESTWEGSTGNTYGPNIDFTMVGAGSSGTVASSGGSLKVAPSQDLSRSLAETYTVGNDTAGGEYPVLYLSYLFENSGSVAPGHAWRVVLRSGTSTVVGFGKEINAGWILRTGGSSATVTVPNSGKIFSLIKLEYNATDDETITTVYNVNTNSPDVDLTDPLTYPVISTLTIPGKASFDNVLIDTNNNNSVRLDEIRLGDNLDHLSAPAPAALLVQDLNSFTIPNTSTPLELAIRNIGLSEDLVITSASFSGPDAAAFSIDPAVFPLTVSPVTDSILPLAITVAGLYQPSYSANLEITSNDPDSPKIVTLQVTNNPDPWIEVSSSLELSNNGSTTNYLIPVNNIGLLNNLTFSSLTVSGEHSANVTNLTVPGDIFPGGNANLEFNFTPSPGLSSHTFTLRLNSNDPASPTKTIDVTMTVIEPLISVSSPRLDFGMTSFAPGQTELPLTLTNLAANETLTIRDTTAITGSPAFSILSPSLPFNIAPGSSQDLVVRFAPGTDFGRLSAQLFIQSNDANGTLPVIDLTAFTDPAGTILARYDFDPQQAFGNVIDLDDPTAAELTYENNAERGFFNALSGSGYGFAARRETSAPGSEASNSSARFTISPAVEGGVTDFTNGTALIETYAISGLGGITSSTWSLFYSTDGGTSWAALGDPQQGASINGSGTATPLNVSWDLSAIGIQEGNVDFILDPSVQGFATNGVISQRLIGFDNLIIAAGVGGTNFASWASSFGLANDPDNDSDLDGIPALVEYALGFSPVAHNPTPGTLIGSTLSFAKGETAVTNGDVTYSIETSANLVDWDSVEPADLVEGTATDPDSISVEIPTGLPKAFARLVIKQVP